MVRSQLVASLPDQLLDRLRFARAARRWSASGVVFVHVPKTAGVSVCNAVYGRPLGHYSVATIHRHKANLLADNYSFAVLRDPLERAVSAYRFARQGGAEGMAIAHPERYRAEVFDSFDTFACDWLLRQDPDRVDGVFRSQSSYLMIDGRVGVEELFHITELTGLASKLRDLLEREIVLRRQNVTAGAPVGTISAAARDAVGHYYRSDYALVASLNRGDSTVRSPIAGG